MTPEQKLCLAIIFHALIVAGGVVLAALILSKEESTRPERQRKG